MTEFVTSSTRDVSKTKVKLLVYGQPKVGKTGLIRTIPRKSDNEILYIPIDPGYLILKDYEFKTISVPNNKWTIKALEDLYRYILKISKTEEHKWCVVDGLDEVGTIVLNELKNKTTNLQKAYGDMADWCDEWIRAMRDIDGLNVIFITHIREKEGTGGEKSTYYPAVPGNKLLESLDKYFDIILCMRYVETEKGITRLLQTSGDADTRFVTGDRSGCLLPLESPDLSTILNKIETNIPGSTIPQVNKRAANLIELKARYTSNIDHKQIIDKYLSKKNVKSPASLEDSSIEELLIATER